MFQAVQFENAEMERWRNSPAEGGMQQRMMQEEGREKSLWWPVSQTLGILRLGQSLETAERGVRRAYGAKTEEDASGPRRIPGRKGASANPRAR